MNLNISRDIFPENLFRHTIRIPITFLLDDYQNLHLG